MSNGGPSPEICGPSFCAAHLDHLRPAVGDCQSTSELTAKSAEWPARRALAVRPRRTIGPGRAVQPDMRRTPLMLRGDHVTTVVDALLEDSVLQSLVPWLFVETVQSAPSHITYMLLGACTVNETSPLCDRSAR